MRRSDRIRSVRSSGPDSSSPPLDLSRLSASVCAACCLCLACAACRASCRESRFSCPLCYQKASRKLEGHFSGDDGGQQAARLLACSLARVCRPAVSICISGCCCRCSIVRASWLAKQARHEAWPDSAIAAFPLSLFGVDRRWQLMMILIINDCNLLAAARKCWPLVVSNETSSSSSPFYFFPWPLGKRCSRKRKAIDETRRWQ